MRALVAAHPRHLVLAAFVAGLPAGRWTPVAAVAAVLAAPLIAPRRAVAVAMAVAALAGVLTSQLRLAALEHSALEVRMGQVVSGQATLLEHPRPGRFAQASALVRLAGERVLVRGPARGAWATLPVGAELRLAGSLRAADPFARRRGAVAGLRARILVPTGRRRGGVAGAIDLVRTRAEAALARGVPAAHGALLRGMVLGDDGAMPPGLRDDFRAAGLSHLTAASGQNVLLLSLLTFGVATLLGFPLRFRLLLVLGAIALYVPLAGAGPSIQRAGVMGAIGIVALMAGRPSSRWYAVGVAAGVTLVIDPRAAGDPGWQMSFAAAAAIVAMGARWTDALVQRRLPGAVAGATAITIAAGLATAPIIGWHFGQVSLVAPLANLLAAPAVAPVMWLGILAGAIGQLGATVPAPVTALASVPAGYLTWLAGVAAGLPGAQLAVPAWSVAVGCVVIAAMLLSRRARRLAPYAAVPAVAVLLGWTLAAHRPPATPDHLRVTFLDVGQGDATLIQHGPAAVLVDAGPPGDGIVRRLQQAGVRRLDALVVTHAQTDHVGGAPAVVGTLPVGMILDGRDGVRSPQALRLAREAARRRVRLVRPDAGQVLLIGRLELRVLWPPREPAAAHAGMDPNGRAIVILMRDAGVRLLLTADAESDVLAGLGIPRIDVLKVAHHGSADPGLAALLRRLRPAVAVTSVGQGNPYGHPAPSTVATLARSVPATYRTDRDGAVRLDAAGGKLTVRTSP